MCSAFYKDGEIAGVLDIDSERTGTFDSADTLWLEKAMAALGNRLSDSSDSGECRPTALWCIARRRQMLSNAILTQAKEMGEKIAKAGFTLVSGGGRMGLMVATIEQPLPQAEKQQGCSLIS